MNAVTALSDAVMRQVIEIRSAWQFVGGAFQSGDAHCETCSFCTHHRDDEPYGEGWATRTYTTCGLGERASDTPEMCPAFQSHLRELREEEES